MKYFFQTFEKKLIQYPIVLYQVFHRVVCRYNFAIFFALISVCIFSKELISRKDTNIELVFKQI